MSASRPPSARLLPAALIVGVVAISFAAICFRKAAPTHPLTAAGLRLSFATVLLLPFVLRARAAGRLDGTLLRAGALAGVAYALHFGSWVTSLTLTSVAASVTLVTATPLLLGVAAVVTGRDRPSPRLWWAIGLATLGLVVIGRNDLSVSQDALLGDGLALFGAAAMAGYLLIARGLGPRLDVPAFMGIACGVGAVLLLGTAAALGVPPSAASPEAWAWLLLSALLPQLVGHTSLTWALRRAKPAVVGMATVGEPVGAAALGWWMLGESVDPVTGLGCAVTASAVVLAVTAERRRSRPPGAATG